jgi:hypothetical protein
MKATEQLMSAARDLAHSINGKECRDAVFTNEAQVGAWAMRKSEQ